MTLALVFILIALGSIQAQALSSGRAVTLHWLRLGDLISLPLLTLAVVIVYRTGGLDSPVGLTTFVVALTLLISVIIHLTLVHLGKRHPQRFFNIFIISAISIFLLAGPYFSSAALAFPIGINSPSPASSSADFNALLIGLSQIISAFLLGGSIMTMMLGHAYLTAGGAMTQKPFVRLTRTLVFAIPIRAAIVIVAGAIPYYNQYRVGALENTSLTWPIMLMVARFTVGLLVPFVMAWMALQCVKIRSNQSATGILYVTGLMLLIGELTALALWAETGLAF